MFFNCIVCCANEINTIKNTIVKKVIYKILTLYNWLQLAIAHTDWKRHNWNFNLKIIHILYIKSKIKIY